MPPSEPLILNREVILPFAIMLLLLGLLVAMFTQTGWSWQLAIVPACLICGLAALFIALLHPWERSQQQHGDAIEMQRPDDGATQSSDEALGHARDTTPELPAATQLSSSDREAVSEAVATLASVVALAQNCHALLAQQYATLESTTQKQHDAIRSASHDPLTGAVTHSTFMTRLSLDVEISRQHERTLAVAVFDVEGFSNFNRRYGYGFGDELLALIADRMRSALDQRMLFGRIGGDRFAVMMAGVSFGEAQSVVQQLRHRVERTPIAVPVDDEQGGQSTNVKVALRVGLALCPDDGYSAEALINLATDAIVSTKHAHNPLNMDLSPGQAPPPPQPGVEEPTLPLATPNAAPMSAIEVIARQHSGIVALTTALESRHPFSVPQAQNLAELAEETALHLGRSIEEARLVGLAVLLHDVGNLGISLDILNKLDPLTTEEWSFVREHPRLGERLLTSVGGLLAALAPMVAAQRERWDGSGYPDHLVGEVIPLGARIVAVCDVYGALISERPYRSAYSREEAIMELRRCSGTQFDPQVVTAFIAALEQ